MPDTIDSAVFERMVEIRRDLHQHPELSWEERRTADRVSAALDELGISHRRVLETGVVADLPGPAGVPIIALRADLDALPILEETGLPFSSVNEGVMHACGHDGHTSMLLGAAELLLGEADPPTPIRLIFQPAEEKGSGARAMMEAGVLEGVGGIFGGHLDRHYPTGALIVTDGAVGASTDHFRIQVTGQGGHAARPHESIDAIVVASLIVMAIQTIVSREVDPAHPSIVSVGKLLAGSASNVIAETALLEGTIRAQHPRVREHLKSSIHRIADSVGQLHGAAMEVQVNEGTPCILNRPSATAVARRAAGRVVDEDSVQELEKANMGGEDFAYYLEEIPGCYIRFGGRVTGREGYPAHSSRFDFDERALAVGAAWFREVALGAGRAVREGGAAALRDGERELRGGDPR